MNRFAFESNNAEFNPLFEKMRERFCAGGTIADQLSKRAAEYKKTKSKRVTAEHHMTTANFLPKNASSTANGKKRSFFSLQSVGSACLLLLVAGTLLFSGAAIGTLRTDGVGNAAVLESKTALSEDTMILFDRLPSQNAQGILPAQMDTFSL